MRRGDTRSCGCLARESAGALHRTHGMTGSKVHRAWLKMLYRCNNTRAKCYPNYGGRGIKVLYKNFEEFYADVGDPPSPRSTIERINNNLGYKPGNVRWATYKEQLRNRRVNHLLTYQGKTQTITAWAEETRLPKNTILSRIKYGYTVADALGLDNRGKQLTWKGDTLYIPQWSRRTGIPVRVIYLRLHRGWSVERTLTQAVRSTVPLTLTLKGKTRTIKAWCERLGLERKILEHRLRRGWSVERTLTQPVRDTRVFMLHGKKGTVEEWSERLSMEPKALRLRLFRGWPLERALTEPPRSARYPKRPR